MVIQYPYKNITVPKARRRQNINLVEFSAAQKDIDDIIRRLDNVIIRLARAGFATKSPFAALNRAAWQLLKFRSVKKKYICGVSNK